MDYLISFWIMMGMTLFIFNLSFHVTHKVCFKAAFVYTCIFYTITIIVYKTVELLWKALI